MPLKWGVVWNGGGPHTVMISIYAVDGTVAITHGGIEIGQGINTKVFKYLITIIFLKYLDCTGCC